MENREGLLFICTYRLGHPAYFCGLRNGAAGAGEQHHKGCGVALIQTALQAFERCFSVQHRNQLMSCANRHVEFFEGFTPSSNGLDIVEKWHLQIKSSHIFSLLSSESKYRRLRDGINMQWGCWPENGWSNTQLPCYNITNFIQQLIRKFYVVCELQSLRPIWAYLQGIGQKDNSPCPSGIR